MNRARTAGSALVATLAVAIAIGEWPALAIQQVKSLYTAIDLRECKILEAPRGGGAWLCEGLPDYPVYVAEIDHRTYLSIGNKGAGMRAAHQTLASANSLFEGSSTRPAVEWRFVIRNGKPVPYATIVRYATSLGDTRGEVLIVTRVTATEACQVAHIDALAAEEAIVLARRIADEKARAFSCAGEPAVVGQSGKSPM